MKSFALDTNIVSYYLKGNKSIIDKILDETDSKNAFGYIDGIKTVNWG